MILGIVDFQAKSCVLCVVEGGDISSGGVVGGGVGGGGGVCCDLVWCHVRHAPGADWQLQHTEPCLSNNIIYTATKLQTAFTQLDRISAGCYNICIPGWSAPFLM